MSALEAGGVRYPLRFTYNSLCALEEACGQAFSSVLRTEFSCVRGLLWCALLDGDPKLTLSRAGSIAQEYLAEHSLEELAEALAGALDEAGFTRPAGRR